MTADGRAVLAATGLGRIARILTLLDRNPHSPTYGCFDRNHWHYRISDFPSGMAQECVWPLALAATLDIPGSPWFGRASLADWAAAGIRFAAASAHRDGSCDDYYPFERAVGASVFSLIACLEAAGALGLDLAPAARFVRARADWLAARRESGRLANHEALTALALELVGRALGTDRWLEAAAARLHRALSWQHAEGWFAEYEGADPGYQTLTIWALARLAILRPALPLAGPIARAVAFASHFVHPDGSYGGIYGSRNTATFFPAGLELAGKDQPLALAVADAVHAGWSRGLDAVDDDDHLLAHRAWSCLCAWRDFRRRPAGLPALPAGRAHFPGAGLLVDRRGGGMIVVALSKGGAFVHAAPTGPAVGDAGVSLLCDGGRRNAVCHLHDRYESEVGEDAITVAGTMGWAKHARMTPARLMALRALMATVGRFFPDLARALLQRLLITAKRPAPFRFRRTIRWRGGGWEVEDEVVGPLERVGEAAIACDQTSIYVAMSRTFRRDALAPVVPIPLPGGTARLVHGRRLPGGGAGGP